MADVIYNEFEFLNKNLDKLIPLADEFKVLTDKEVDELKELSETLAVADVFVNHMIHFNGLVSSEEMGRVVGLIYGKYLKEVKNLSEEKVDEHMNQVLKLIELSEKFGDELQNEKLSEEDQLRFIYCSAFAKMYSGDNLSEERVRGKNFAAFKLAKNLMKADLVGQMLKEYKVNFT